MTITEKVLTEELELLKKYGIQLDKLIEIDDELYHSLPGISSTFLKNMQRCPAYAWYKKNEDRGEPTEALIVGRAIHTIVLQPEKFKEQFQIAPTDDKRKKEYKEWVSKISDPDKTILRSSFAPMAKGILRELTNGSNLLDNVICNPSSEIEKAVFTVDKKHGVLIKMKSDVILGGMGFDLKSTVNAGYKDFITTIGKYGYDIQAAFYIRVCQTAKVNMNAFSFIAVEKEPPYLSTCTALTAESIILANRVIDVLLEEYVECQEKGSWDGYYKDGDDMIVPVSSSSWRQHELEIRLLNKQIEEEGDNNENT